MSIRAPDDINLTLALRAFEAEDHEEAIEFFRRCTASEQRSHKECVVHAHYCVGVALCAEDNFGRSREHFNEARILTDDASLKHICQERLRLAKAIPPVPDWLSSYGGDCDDCAKNKALLDCATCDRRGMPVNPVERIGQHDLRPYISEIHCVGAYRYGWDPQSSNPFSQAIRRMKRRGGKKLAVALGHMLADFLSGLTDLRSRVDFITPVPTTVERYAERGFRIPDILADIISSRLAIPSFRVLVLARETRDLRGLSSTERRSELDGAFGVSEQELVGSSSILVVDDVVTYGTTVSEAARTLRQVDARDVFAAVLAHTESSF